VNKVVGYVLGTVLRILSIKEDKYSTRHFVWVLASLRKESNSRCLQDLGALTCIPPWNCMYVGKVILRNNLKLCLEMFELKNKEL